MDVRRLALPVVVAVGLHLALLGLHVARQGGDVSVLVGVNDSRLGHAPWERVTRSLGPGGYDGMFYYAIAQRPWALHVEGIDAPAPRHVRVLYPLLCWMVTGGEQRALILAMPAVNLVLIGALAWLGASAAQAHGRSPWWGVGLVLGISVALPALRDLTDCLSTLGVCGLLLAWLDRRSVWLVAAWAAVALFSREQNLAILVLLGMASLATWQLAPLAGLVAVAVVWSGWVAYLGWAYGTWPFLTSHGNLAAVPLGGLWYGWTHLGGPCGSTRLAICNATSLAHWTVLLGVAGFLAVKAPTRTMSAFLMLALLTAISAGPWIYDDLMSYRRVLVCLPLGIWLTGLRSGRGWAMMSLLPAPVWSVAAALKYV